MTDISKKAKKIKLVAVDVDGVMTDGSLNLFYTPKKEPVEIKRFYALDGVGIAALRQCGVRMAIITGGSSSATEISANFLGFEFLYHDFFVKLPALEDLAKRTGLKYEEICFIGDDIIDLPVLKRVGLSVGVPNAAPDVKKHVDFTTKNAGGMGAVRETAEFILKAQGKWKSVLEDIDKNNFPFPKQGCTKISPKDLK